MNIKTVSEQTGISADTIRYYERIGLIPRVKRQASGVRDFSERDIAALEFVRCFRRAGVGIESLIEYMGLVEAGDGTEQARLDLLEEEERVKLEARIAELQEAHRRLNRKIQNYQNIVLKKEQHLFNEEITKS